MPYTQEDRLIGIETPLGKDVLLPAAFDGEEAISRPFVFELSMLSENHGVSFDSIIGRTVTVSLRLADGNTRYFNGIISSFSAGRGGGENAADCRFSHYHATIVPWLWTLSRSAGSRIFQNISVPEIVEKVFKAHGHGDYRFCLTGSYAVREYCVQYRETDLNFVSRLLEEEGIFYFFEHERDKHTMVLADSPSAKHCPYQKTASCSLSGNGTREDDLITALEITQGISPSRYTLNDFNFKVPNTSLQVQLQGKNRSGIQGNEIYDAPGGFDDRAAGERTAKIRIEEEEAQAVKISGRSGCRAFSSGCRFTLQGHSNPDLNKKDYLILSVRHSAAEAYAPDALPSYLNSFTCLPYSLTYRPPRLTPRPVVHGTQTAMVVGPPGEEIHTDRHGRVKVRFHWDREGKKDENSSCWIRVSQLWAGNGWGALYLPRVGQEVIVDFLEGNPDRPVIIGQLYNGLNLPPYPLPEGRAISCLKTHSTPEGDGGNEIRFQDKKGEEHLFIHAEKQLDRRVEEDALEWVGRDRHLIVRRNSHEKVCGDHHVTVSQDRNEKVEGTLSVTVNEDLQQKVGMRHALQAGQEIHLKAGARLVLEAAGQICLRAGGNFIAVAASGITIVGNVSSSGTPLSGFGASPEEPTPPKESGASGAGDQLRTAGAEPVKLGPQAAALKKAAQIRAPLCST